jgi:hypothetical protein
VDKYRSHVEATLTICKERPRHPNNAMSCTGSYTGYRCMHLHQWRSHVELHAWLFLLTALAIATTGLYTFISMQVSFQYQLVSTIAFMCCAELKTEGVIDE